MTRIVCALVKGFSVILWCRLWTTVKVAFILIDALADEDIQYWLLSSARAQETHAYCTIQYMMSLLFILHDGLVSVMGLTVIASSHFAMRFQNFLLAKVFVECILKSTYLHLPSSFVARALCWVARLEDDDACMSLWTALNCRKKNPFKVTSFCQHCSYLLIAHVMSTVYST